MKLKVVTYNMHKGKSFWFRDYRLNVIREQIQKLEPEIVFLQEAPGVHPKSASYLLDPVEYFADQTWPHHCYGKNAVYDGGHHGNAIISKYTIDNHINHDISQTRLAKRGLLHAQVNIKESGRESLIHLLNVHLDLTAKARRLQTQFILNYVKSHLDSNDRIILAGDFNDWQGRLDADFRTMFDRELVEKNQRGQKTFPALKPIYDLDRVYTRNLSASGVHVPREGAWKSLSDHLPLCVDVDLA
tara:strand:+ start:196 stop:927 length:732 start_codon:yes stop_codon:yes gene_type:complete